MNSGHLALSQAVQAVLSAAPALADGGVHINRRRPMEREATTAIFITLDATRAVREVIGATDWRTRVVLECVSRAQPGQDPAAAVDALLAGAYARVLGLNHQYLPDLLEVGSTPDIDWIYDDADLNVATARITFEAQHRTQRSSLTPWSQA